MDDFVNSIINIEDKRLLNIHIMLNCLISGAEINKFDIYTQYNIRKLRISYKENNIIIDYIETETPGSGDGTRFMDDLIMVCDEMNMHIIIDLEGYHNPILEKWIKKFKFKRKHNKIFFK